MSTTLCATAKDYYLMHYGIKGQKWGIRRWQNEDGSLTAEGQARYNGKTNVSQLDENEKADLMKTIKLENSINKEVADIQRRADEDKRDVLDSSARVLDATARALPSGNGKYVKKDYSNLTDQQLRERISRLQLEESYGRLTGDTKYVKSGSERAKEILQTAGAIIAIGSSAAALAIKIKSAMGSHGAAKVGAKAAAKTGQLLLTQSDIDEEDDNSLQHHGVKGQKWGVRKYQDEDGKLTAQGKLKYLRDHNPLPPLIPTPKNVKNYVNKVNGTAKKVTKTVDKGINKVTDYSKLGIKKTTNATKRVLDYLTHPQKIDKKIKQKVSNLAKKIDARKSLKQQAAKGKARVDNILATPVEAIS